MRLSGPQTGLADMISMRAQVAVVCLLLAAPLIGGVLPVAAIGETVNIANVAPIVTAIALSGGSFSSGTLTPTSGTTSSITATVTATDANGFADITGVTVGIIKPDGSTLHLAQAAGAFATGSGITTTWTKTLTMNFYDAVALTTNTYKVKAIATDAAAATSTVDLTLGVFNYAQLVAMSAPSSIDLAGSSISPGAAGAITSLAVQNYGNAQMDTQVSGTSLTFAGDTIPLADISYSLASNLASPAVLTGSAATISSFDLALGASSSKNIYFQITTTPTGLAAGAYTGTLTVTAVAG